MDQLITIYCEKVKAKSEKTDFRVFPGQKNGHSEPDWPEAPASAGLMLLRKNCGVIHSAYPPSKKKKIFYPLPF